MDNNTIIHVVHIVAFTAIKDLNILVCTGNLGRTFPILNGMQRIGKRLAAAVIGNSDGSVSPGGCLLDGILGIGQGIHIGHNGMQVQLYTLVPSGIVFSLFHRAGHHSHRPKNHFIIKLIDLQSALHLQHRTHLYVFQNRLCLIVLHKAIDLH